MAKSEIVLITGCNGQLGNELRLLAQSYAGLNFIFTDYDELDITCSEAVETFFAAHQPHFVVNCAAYTAVDKAEGDEANAMRLNGLAPGILAQMCKKHTAKLVHISTDYVFDGKNHTPYLETDPTCPISAYGRTKLQGELAVMESGVAMVIRTAWLYSSFGGNFVKTMLRLASTKSEIGVVADQVGTPTYARDLAAAIMAIIASGSFPTEIFHFTNEGACTWYDLAHEVIKKSGQRCVAKPITTVLYPTPATRPCYSILSKQKIKTTFNIDIPHWRDSLDDCLKLLI